MCPVPSRRGHTCCAPTRHQQSCGFDAFMDFGAGCPRAICNSSDQCGSIWYHRLMPFSGTRQPLRAHIGIARDGLGAAQHPAWRQGEGPRHAPVAAGAEDPFSQKGEAEDLRAFQTPTVKRHQKGLGLHQIRHLSQEPAPSDHGLAQPRYVQVLQIAQPAMQDPEPGAGGLVSEAPFLEQQDPLPIFSRLQCNHQPMDAATEDDQVVAACYGQNGTPADLVSPIVPH